MLYELRHYDAAGPLALGRLEQQFADHTLRIWDRIGIEAVGFWSALVGTRIPRLTYLLAWSGLAQRQELWDIFTTDPEWQQAHAEDNARAGGSAVQTITSSILEPLPFSTLPRRNSQPVRLAGGVFELRTYAFSDPAKLEQAADWFRDHGLRHFDKHRMFVMGLWTTYLGVTPRLNYMLVFENLAHRERAWAGFYTDPAWPALQEGLYPQGQMLIEHVESCLMKGTEFSGWR